MTFIPGLLGIFAIVMSGFIVSTVMFDRGVPNYLSRKVMHIFGGLAYLLGVLTQEAQMAVVLSVWTTSLLIAVRIYYPRLLRGVGGSARPHAIAELTYPVAGTISLAIGWWWLGDKWLAFVPIGFMAFGDSITGIVRSAIYKREVKGIWGSVAMLIVCLGVAALYPIYWIGAVGAVVATVAEKLSPVARGAFDDNWILVAASLGIMVWLR